MRRRRRNSLARSRWLGSPLATVFGALIMALLLAGCSEKPQDPVNRQVGTTVTRDTSPWEAQPSRFAVAGHAGGDKAAYEQALKRRAQVQNEYVRIGTR